MIIWYTLFPRILGSFGFVGLGLLPLHLGNFNMKDINPMLWIENTIREINIRQKKIMKKKNPHSNNIMC